MTNKTYASPQPRQEMSAPDFTRPKWYKINPRGERKLWLDRNENNDPELAMFTHGILCDIPQRALYSYPEMGLLYKKLAGYSGLDPANILITAGSDGAIRAAFEAFIRPGDRVLHTNPSFAMYEIYSRMFGANAKCIDYSLHNNGPKLESKTIIEAIRKYHPKLVCLPNPDSPTGTAFHLDTIQEIIQETGRRDSLILIDEAYYPFYPDTVMAWVTTYPHLIVTRSMAKAWGLAGLRLGYAVADTTVANILHKVRPMYETNTIAVALMERLIDHPDEMLASVERLKEGKKLFTNAMIRLGFRVLPCQGNFMHVAFGKWGEEIHAKLEDIAYYRRNFTHPCLKGFSRFSATTAELFEPVLSGIEQVMQLH